MAKKTQRKAKAVRRSKAVKSSVTYRDERGRFVSYAKWKELPRGHRRRQVATLSQERDRRGRFKAVSKVQRKRGEFVAKAQRKASKAVRRPRRRALPSVGLPLVEQGRITSAGRKAVSGYAREAKAQRGMRADVFAERQRLMERWLQRNERRGFEAKGRGRPARKPRLPSYKPIKASNVGIKVAQSKWRDSVGHLVYANNDLTDEQKDLVYRSLVSQSSFQAVAKSGGGLDYYYVDASIEDLKTLVGLLKTAGDEALAGEVAGVIRRMS